MGVSLYSINFDIKFITLINSFAELYSVFNSKNAKLQTSVLYSFKNKIEKMIIEMGEFVTNKLHAFLHYISNILKRGMFWNYSAFVFESFFGSLKKVARDCKVDPFPALENFFSNLSSTNIFQLPKNVLLKFGCEEKKVNFFINNQPKELILSGCQI